MSETTFAAIPTEYRNVRFRSRLEARWAAFFDLLEWPWEYEPFDLQGYIPDFVLTFKRPLLVEVKPALSLDELRPHVQKIEASGWVGEALLLGARVFDRQTTYPYALVAGLISNGLDLFADPDEINRPDWSEAGFIACPDCAAVTLFDTHNSYACLRCGKQSYGGHPTRHTGGFEVASLFAEAGNAVQWRPAR